MRVITGTREFQIEEPTAVTIGKFDGRHKGHQKLLREMLCSVKGHVFQEMGQPVLIILFHESPHVLHEVKIGFSRLHRRVAYVVS